jgi:hypothetical protein
VVLMNGGCQRDDDSLGIASLSLVGY